MALDSPKSYSTADENIPHTDKADDAVSSCAEPCFPKGNHVIELDRQSGSRILDMSPSETVVWAPVSEDSTAWGYLLVHYKKVDRFEAEVNSNSHFKCFIHKSTVYTKSPKGGVKKQEKPSVSGLVFLQGRTSELQKYLYDNFFPLHLVNDRTTGRPAVIPDRQMRPFMQLMQVDPTRIRILEKPVSRYADGNVKLRILSGVLAGQEGYLVRIARDRKLVINLGGIAVAISDVHKEQFEEIKEIL